MRVGEQFDDPEGPMPDGLAVADEAIERPLSAFTDDEVFDELRLRYASFVFYGDRQRHDDYNLLTGYYKGSWPTIIGLCTQALWRLQQQFASS
jgi:hypothetical protein